METLWAMEEAFLDGFLAQITSQITDEMLPEIEASTPGKPADILKVGADGHATIEIKGPLSPNGPSKFMTWLGIDGTSYNSIIQAAGEALEDEDIKEVTLKINSPGGTVAGADETWSALMALSAQKKVVAENHGMIASGAYWLASAASEIRATSPTVITGSIGVVYTTYTYSDGLKKVFSKNAPNKQPTAGTKKGDAIIREEINAIERIFINRISIGRKVTEEKIISDFGQGGVFVAQDPDKTKPDAISTGMIDGMIIGTEVKSGGKKVSAIEDSNNTLATEPKNGEGHTQEESAMNLAEIFAKHPELRSEVQAMVDEATAKATTQAIEAEREKTKKVSVFLKADYPKPVHDLACEVLEGTEEFTALRGAVVVLDSLKAQEKLAKAEGDPNPDTSNGPPAKPKTPEQEAGYCETEEDFQAALKEAKGAI